jgi:hypothetical protein
VVVAVTHRRGGCVEVLRTPRRNLIWRSSCNFAATDGLGTLLERQEVAQYVLRQPYGALGVDVWRFLHLF